MESIKLSLDIFNPSEFHNIGIELWIDSTKFFDNNISPGKHHVVHEFDGNDGDHVFKIVLKNKTHEHTTISADGNIMEDVLIEVSNISLDDVSIDQMMWDLAEYIHDGNGMKEDPASHRYYGKLGCNGHVVLEFSCPVYIWFLENI